jgi:CDP-diacylglycerol--serine O-phosphatidyltransferase
MKQNIPNLVTLFNLFFGCCAIVSVLSGEFISAFWFFFAAGLADYLDGTAARLLDVGSPMGKELDSLADMVSFGLLPGVIFYTLLEMGWTGGIHHSGVVWKAAPGFIITLFSALRLGKFNLDTRQTDYFIGLPTPSSCLFAVGLMMIYEFDSFGWGSWIVRPAFLYSYIALLSYTMVAELPMFSMKFKSFKWPENRIKFIFAGVVILLLLFLREAALPVVILLYILVSMILNWLDYSL